jgi:hypothetical protein
MRCINRVNSVEKKQGGKARLDAYLYLANAYSRGMSNN